MAGGTAEVAIRGKDETSAAFKSAQQNLRNLASSAAVLEGPLGGVAGRMNAIGAALGRVNPLTLAAGVAISGLAVIVKSATDEAGEYEQSLFRVNAVLKQTGGISGQTSDQIQRMAKELGDATLTNEKDVLRASAVLLRYTNVQNEFFEKTLKAGQDAAAVFGGDLASNVAKIARALDNPRRGLELLERNLITVNQAWKDNVIAMFEAGRVAEAQTAIFEQLNAIQGTGAEEAKGYKGALDSLGEAWTILIRNFAASGPIQDAAKALTELFKVTSDGLDTSPLAMMNRLIAEQEKALIELSKTSQFSFSNGYKFFVSEINNRQIAIDQLSHQIDLAKEQEKAEQALVKVKQQAAIAARILEKDEAALQAFFTRNALLNLKIEEDLQKEKEVTRKAALAVWEAALPPQEKLDKAYIRVSDQLIKAFKKGAISAPELTDILGAVDLNFEVQTKATNVKEAKGTSRADQVREQLLQEEAQIDLSYQRRALVVADASALLADDQLAKQAELQNTQLLLAEEHEQKLLDLRVAKLTAYADAFSSIAGSIASYYEGHSRRLTASINKDYQARADKVREGVKTGVLTQKQGNQQLDALESQRIQNQEKQAKKEFENGKKLRRVEAVINTAAAMTSVLASQPGDLSIKLAAAAAIGVAGALQLANINASQYEGGGSINTGGISGGATPVQAAPAETQQNNNIVIVGNSSSSFSLEQVVGLIDSIREVSGRLDLTVVDSSSRNARDIRDSANGLVI